MRVPHEPEADPPPDDDGSPEPLSARLARFSTLSPNDWMRVDALNGPQADLLREPWVEPLETRLDLPPEGTTTRCASSCRVG
jgi:hypothetical protein